MPETRLENNKVLQLRDIRKLRKDELAEMVQDFFREAREYRQDFELVWGDAYDAYHSRFPTRLDAVQDLAKDRGIWVNMTRRKVNNARVKINSLLFESGKVPFEIKPNHVPRYIPKDLRQLPPSDILETLHTRALNMENRIRDVLYHTDYFGTISDVILEMCLYGTGVTKAVTVKSVDYPVFDSPRNQNLRQAEDFYESELLPIVEPISIWNVFPSAEATSSEDAEYFIQRSYVSLPQLRRLGTLGGFDMKKIEEAIDAESGVVEGEDQSDSPNRITNRPAERIKKYEILEFWGVISREDLQEYIDVPDSSPDTISCVITVLGDKVLRVVENPFDGRMPYHFCYWQKNNDIVWGDGIYFGIRDYQAIANFTMAQIIEGKSISSNPMMVVDPMSFERGEDLKNARPGKIFKVKPGSDVNQAFRPIIVPDVSNGLIDLFKLIERETDLDSGQTAIGAGETSSYQTRTATGMSILNSNSNKLTAEVVRSVSNMIQRNVEQIYYWLMADSVDATIKGDFEAKCTGFIEYLSKEVHNTQLLNMLAVFSQNPEMKEYVKYQELVRPIVRAFSMDPDLVVMTDDEKKNQDQQNMQKAEMVAQKEIDMKEKMSDAEAIREEKKSIGEDSRKSMMLERLELIKQGNMLREMPDFSSLSVLMQEEMQKENMLQQELAMSQDIEGASKDMTQEAARMMTEQQGQNDQGANENPGGRDNQPSGGPPIQTDSPAL